MVELVHLLGAEKAAQAVRVFGEAFIRSMPTGKQNSFANRTCRMLSMSPCGKISL